MGSDTVGAKPSVCFMEGQGIRISGGLIICKSMKMAFWTKQSVHIIVDCRISGMSIRCVRLYLLIPVKKSC